LFHTGMHQSLVRSNEYAWTPEILAGGIGNLAGAVGAAALSLGRDTEDIRRA